MLVVGLVHDSSWRPDDDDLPPPRPRRAWRLPWRPLAWLAAFCVLLALASVVGRAFGGLAGYAVLMLAVAVGLWRVDRWCAGQYWHGLRDYQA